MSKPSSFTKSLVKISSNKIGLNQNLQVNFIMKGQASNFRPPQFKDFRVISGPNVSSSVQNVNGQVSQSLTYSYYLQPKKVGNFTISSFLFDQSIVGQFVFNVFFILPRVFLAFSLKPLKTFFQLTNFLSIA